MHTRFSAAVRFALIACGALAFAAARGADPGSAPAATAPVAAAPDATTPASPQTPDTAAPTPAKPAVPAPPNPLIMVSPQTGSGNATTYYDPKAVHLPGTKPADESDYRAPAGQPGQAGGAKPAAPLPYFGYDFFQPARQIIEAHRAYALRRYKTPPPNGNFDTGGTDSGMSNMPFTDNGSDRTRSNTPTGARNDSGSNPNSNQRDTGTGSGPYQPPGPYQPRHSQSDPYYSNDNSYDANRSRSDTMTDDNGGYGGDNGYSNYNNSQYGPDDGSPYSTRRSSSQRANNNDGGTGTANAYNQVVDPITLLYQNISATPSGNYQLAPGDRLTVRYSSPTFTPREFTRAVDPQGGLLIEGVGRVIVRGLTPTQAENAIRARLLRFYTNVDVSVTLQELRTISVTVSGAAYDPGTRVVPSVLTAFDLLYAAGGPTQDGSLRDIRVIRRGRTVGTLDFYKFLTGGGQAVDIPLQPGDNLNIPSRISSVTLRGEVRHAAIYELKDNETLRDALRYAGGIKASGVAQNVQITTLDPGAARIVKEVNLKDKAQVAKTPLYDGDTVDIYPVRLKITNRVTIEGAVDQPGDYALDPGMHVSDLLRRARGPVEDAYLTRADLYRWNPDNTTTLVPIDIDKALAGDTDANLPLARYDRLKLYTRQEVSYQGGTRPVVVRGPVQRPGIYYRSDNMRVSDLLLQAGGPTPEAYLNRAVLLHQQPDGSFKYDYVSLNGTGQGPDPLLQDNDVLAVYREGEQKFTPNHVVTILGEVVAPGVYPRGEEMHLSDLLTLSGGFRPGADTRISIAHARHSIDTPNTVRLASVSADINARGLCEPDVILQDGDVVTVQGNGGFRQDVQIVNVSGAVNRPGPITLSGHMRLSDAINRAGGLRPEAFPEGIEFTRNPTLMASNEQRSIANIIARLNDLLNKGDYQTAAAKGDIEKIKATVGANQSSTSIIPLAGASAIPAAPVSNTTSQQLFQRELVPLPRVLPDNELQPNGNLAVNLAAAVKHPGGREDIALMDGDTLVIPEKPTTVQVVGAVYNARGSLFVPGKSLTDYVNAAGGLTPDAAPPSRIEVIHAGGGLIPASKAGAIQPGDLILVPTKVMAVKLDHGGNGFANFFQGLAGTAILLKVLGL